MNDYHKMSRMQVENGGRGLSSFLPLSGIQEWLETGTRTIREQLARPAASSSVKQIMTTKKHYLSWPLHRVTSFSMTQFRTSLQSLCIRSKSK